MLEVKDLQIRIGARVLLDGVSFRVDTGDKVGLVGRNGAGKTTLTKVISGEFQATEGYAKVTGEVGYLPQDPRAANPRESARTRILDARGLGHLISGMTEATTAMASSDAAISEAAMKKYGRLNDQFLAAGGYQAEAEAATIASHLNLPHTTLDQELGTLSGGQRRRIELARILFQNAPLMVLDEPTNHLDADSVVWLRNFLQNYPGGVIVISHDVGLVEETVNRVFIWTRCAPRLTSTTCPGSTIFASGKPTKNGVVKSAALRRKRRRPCSCRRLSSAQKPAKQLQLIRWWPEPRGCSQALMMSGEPNG